tara:strand:- start:6966 stop:7358 length:393 start_codon:yes stop_codon:yes gene_type:complete
MVVDRVNAKTILPIVNSNLANEAVVYTDEAAVYKSMYKHHKHDFVRHDACEWGRGEIDTNRIEGYFSILKRGMKCIYLHCGKQHLHRYLAEYDCRYNHRAKNGYTDTERADALFSKVSGKRLTYQRPLEA